MTIANIWYSKSCSPEHSSKYATAYIYIFPKHSTTCILKNVVFIFTRVINLFKKHIYYYSLFMIVVRVSVMSEKGWWNVVRQITVTEKNETRIYNH